MAGQPIRPPRHFFWQQQGFMNTSQKIAEDPKLSPAAAEAARNQVRTYQAAVWCFEKAFAYHDRTVRSAVDER
jgi:hypothetical protein